MPETIILEDGTEREVPTEEELQELRKRSEERKKQREEIKTELEQTKEKLKKLENKDFNFKKLREMTEEEKKKLTEVELQLKEQQEKLEEEQNKFKENLISNYKNEALAVLVGNDKKIRDKVLHNYDRIQGEAITKEEVAAKMREAYNMLGLQTPTVNPINTAVNLSGNNPVVPPASDLTPEQKDLASKLGITDEDLKNNSGGATTIKPNFKI